MKSIVIKEYVHGLVSFLDENRVKWERVSLDSDDIRIWYKSNEELFEIGFGFGVFSERIGSV